MSEFTRKVQIRAVYIAGYVYDAEVIGFGGHRAGVIEQAQRDLVLLSQGY